MAAEKQVLKYDCATVNNLLDTVNENKDLFPFDTVLNASSQRGLPNSVIAKEINALKDTTSNNKGYFLTAEKLKAAYPIASEGSKAYVGNKYPYAIYLFQSGAWTNSGQTGGDDNFSAGEFYTRVEIDQQHEVINNEIARVEKGANYEVLEYETSIATTRLKVPEGNRKGGYMITYNPGTGWIKEQYIGTAVTNEEWIKDENWKAEILNDSIQAIAENAQQQANLAATNAALAEEKGAEAVQIAHAAADEAVQIAQTAGEEAQAKGNEAVQIATTKGNEAVQIATTKGNEAVQIAQKAGDRAVSIANVAKQTADAAAEEANTQAAYAKEQGDIAAQRGVGKIDSNSDRTGEIFNNYTNNVATGSYSHAEGFYTVASEDYGSHAEGYRTTASGIYGSHAEGSSTTASGGYGSHAEGHLSKASRTASHAEGSYTTASGDYSHAEGYYTTASGGYSHTGGHYTIADNYAQTSIGRYNTEDSSPSSSSYNSEKPALVIGNGTSSTRGNAFKVLFNGKTYADGTYSSSGADYAEQFEWKDGNPLNEDRVGRFVTLKGKNIEIADETSTYILGIVSGAPTIIGDDPMRWQGKYANDEWGRPIYEDIEVTYTEYEVQSDETVKEVQKTRIDHVRKLNPLYNPQEKYIPRAERQEWDYIGMMGKLLVRQDGTLIEGGFCKSGKNGIATASDNGYYVMEVISENQALILFR